MYELPLFAKTLDFRHAPRLKIGKYACLQLYIFTLSLSHVRVQAGGMHNAPSCFFVLVSGKIASKRRDILLVVAIDAYFTMKIFISESASSECTGADPDPK